jgi:hypothetical protein
MEGKMPNLPAGIVKNHLVRFLLDIFYKINRGALCTGGVVQFLVPW